MKSTIKISALLAPVALVRADWWGGAPDCAHSCLSSFYSSATGNSWPSPDAYCTSSDAAPIATCISSSCSATPTAFSSYSSLSSSLCSRFSSCSSAGSTGVYTVSWPGATATGSGWWGPGCDDDDDNCSKHGGMGGMWGSRPGWTASYTGGTYTVTGCPWDGSPWFGGAPGGWGGDHGTGWNGWGDWGHGWTWKTHTATVTTVVTQTATGSGSGSVFTTTGLATVAEAVSGDVTSTTTLVAAAESGTGSGAASSATNTPNAAAPGASGDLMGVGFMGAVLGGIVALVGML